jgi:pimeloyl-ACP methyl ester carboxylesterase
MNIVCLGHGSPTVMFEYGLGGNLLNWKRIVEPVSELSTACFYERAGYGDSDAPSRAMTAQNVTDDLYWLLDKAGVRRPIVLVGHSLGGLYATLYADRFPSQVAGLVLIDPAFAGQDLGETPEEKERAAAIYAQSQVNIMRCATLAHEGRLSSSNPAGCFALPADATPPQRVYLVQRYAKPARWDAMLSESKTLHTAGALSEDESEEQRAARSFGDKPVIVLTAGFVPTPPGETEDEHRKSVAHWKAGHDRLAERSSHGESVVVPNATHMIQLDQPQAVIEAIRKVVLAVRTTKATVH